MAVEKIKKIYICAPKENRKPILQLVQRYGCVEVEQLDLDGFEKMNTSTQISVFEKNVVACEKALENLAKYSDEKVSIFAGLEGKRDITNTDFRSIESNRQELMKCVNDINIFAEQINDLELQIAKEKDEQVIISPWVNLDVPMNYMGTRDSEMIIGSIRGCYTQEELNILFSEMEDIPKDIYARVVSNDKYSTYITALVMKGMKEEVENALRPLEFSKPLYITHHLPSESIERRNTRIGLYEQDIETIIEDIRQKMDQKNLIEQLADYNRVRADKYRVLGELSQTEHTFFITGNIPERSVPELKSEIESNYTSVVETEDIEGEQPVLLKNNKFTGAVEGVVTAFGFPNKMEIDPTAITAFFYYFLFGIMLSDAAYGLIMFLGCLWAIKKFPNMSEGLQKSLRMFMYCGISTLIWGLLFGGFFGDAVTVIGQTFFNVNIKFPALWFEPINQPMKMLIYCMIFGIVHLFVGLGIKGYLALRNKDIYGFISESILWYIFLIGLLMMLIPTDMFASLVGTKIVFPEWANTLAIVFVIAGAVGILLMAGRGRKNPVKRLLLGVYSLYDITGWLSDLLSYSRLLALGLATGVIAQVVNKMASMGGKSVVGVIMFILVFVIGHVFNMAVNLLGAYVHTNRLQFVEFFGKFYEGGGREFKPFKENTKYVKVKNER